MSTSYSIFICARTSDTFSSTSGTRSSRQAPINTPPAKHEAKLITFLHLLLAAASLVSRTAEKSFKGIMPKRKVTTIIVAVTMSFSVRREEPFATSAEVVVALVIIAVLPWLLRISYTLWVWPMVVCMLIVVDVVYWRWRLYGFEQLAVQ